MQKIVASDAGRMNDNVSVSMAKYEPRITLIRNPAFRFYNEACLAKRMLDAIELRELAIRPSPLRSPLWPSDYRAGHDELVVPASNVLVFYDVNKRRTISTTDER
jgi:hypothetical protein